MAKVQKEKKKNSKAVGPLREGISTALRALDSQIDRELQRTPAERQVLGVTKWEPINKRVEDVTEYLLVEFGNSEYTVESLCIMAQSYCKALSLLAEELGDEGLGRMKFKYVQDALNKIGLAATKRSTADEIQ